MHKKTAVVYNRWLFRKGGGEYYSLCLAIALKKLGYAVDLASTQAVSFQELEKQFNLDLSDMHFCQWKPGRGQEMSGIAGGFDLFVNASHLDYFPGSAKKNWLVVYFPSRLWCKNVIQKIKDNVIQFLQQTAQWVICFQGGKSQNNSQEIEFEPITHSRPKIYLNIDQAKPALTWIADKVPAFTIGAKEIVPVIVSQNDNIFRFQFPKSDGWRTDGLSWEWDGITKVRVSQVDDRGWRSWMYQLVSAFSQTLKERLNGSETITSPKVIQSYDEVISISEFTQKYVQKFWSLESTVIHPPVEQIGGEQHKKPWILHVGRFIATGHNKKQLELVQAFRELFNQLSERQQSEVQLHLVGQVAQGEVHQYYFDEVQRAAQGMPVFFHKSMDKEELRNMYKQASLYWHATGYGENVEQSPEKAEHFGITTVEAMSAGCVPLAYASGGQSEIIQSNCGVLWHSQTELVHATLTLLQNESRRKELSIVARKRAQEFSIESFVEHIRNLLES